MQIWTKELNIFTDIIAQKLVLKETRLCMVIWMDNEIKFVNAPLQKESC